MSVSGIPAPSIIGQRIPRVEDSRLLRGLGCYVDDVPEPPGTLHLAFVLSPHAHARIMRVGRDAARRMPGVVDVLAGADFLHVKPQQADLPQRGYQVVPRPVMAIDRVRFVGELVAVVIAEDRYRAEDAAEQVEIEYEPLAAVVEAETACAPGAPTIHEGTRDNVIFQASFKSEGFDAAFDGAGLVVQDRFDSARLAIVSIEPRGCLAIHDPGRDGLTFYTGTQIPHIVRSSLAELLDWDERSIRVIAPDVGGGFGMKAYLYPEEVITAAIARRLQCAVKWICDRREDLMTSNHSRDYRFDVALAFDRDGTLRAVKADILCNIGAYPLSPFGSSVEAGGAALYLPGPYRLKHYAFTTRAVATHTCPTGVYRGVAAPVAFFATEGLMDRAARILGVDPVEIRRRNILQPSEFPYVNVLGIRYNNGSYAGCLERALQAIGYAEFRREQPPGRLVDGRYRGIGVASIVEHTGQGASRYRDRGLLRIPGYDSALVKLEPNGKAVAWVSQATQGQGHLTVFAQLVADVLGVAVGDVTIVEGDTAQGPYGTGTFASRGAVTGSGAVLRASAQVAEKIRRIAAHMLEASPGDIELIDGRARVKGVPRMGIAIREIAAIAYSVHSRALPPDTDFGLEATNYYDPPVAAITNATHAAQVSIDAVTGLITVERYVVAHDCGRVINPLIVEGQIHGAVVQGLGSVLSEAIRFDSDGQLMTANLLDYRLPTIADVPDIEVLHEETWSADTEGGFKGVGEGGVIGALPAIANAVADALLPFQARIRRLPLTPERVSELMTTPP